MSYTVSNTDSAELELNESSYVDSVLQNIRCLLSTWEGEVPLYRDYGLNPELLHRPINVVESLLVADITDKIEKYEPRAQVINVSFTGESQTPDVLGISVEVEIEGEEDEEDYE